MTVGGRVELIADQNSYLRITVIDEKDMVSVKVKKEEGTQYLKLGDDLWWQAGKVLWTPAKSNLKGVAYIKKVSPKKTYDFEFTKIAYSF